MPVASTGSPKGKGAGTDKKSLTSPINGVVLEIPIKEGDAVKQNDVLFGPRSDENEDQYFVATEWKELKRSK